MDVKMMNRLNIHNVYFIISHKKRKNSSIAK